MFADAAASLVTGTVDNGGRDSFYAQLTLTHRKYLLIRQTIVLFG